MIVMHRPQKEYDVHVLISYMVWSGLVWSVNHYTGVRAWPGLVGL